MNVITDAKKKEPEEVPSFFLFYIGSVSMRNGKVKL